MSIYSVTLEPCTAQWQVLDTVAAARRQPSIRGAEDGSHTATGLVVSYQAIILSYSQVAHDEVLPIYKAFLLYRIEVTKESQYCFKAKIVNKLL